MSPRWPSADETRAFGKKRVKTCVVCSFNDDAVGWDAAITSTWPSELATCLCRQGAGRREEGGRMEGRRRRAAQGPTFTLIAPLLTLTPPPPHPPPHPRSALYGQSSKLNWRCAAAQPVEHMHQYHTLFTVSHTRTSFDSAFIGSGFGDVHSDDAKWKLWQFNRAFVRDLRHKSVCILSIIS